MKIGLIDVDGHHYPNLALMKISGYHKAQGDQVDWWNGWEQYDRVYMSKVFDETYTADIDEPYNTKEVIKGGTGYDKKSVLPDEIEHWYPDYSLYPSLTQNCAFGYLSRGCPNCCGFCLVSEKEGKKTVKTADLREWWNGQKNIVLMDANILACPEHMELLGQLANSGAYVDINQGLDARKLTEENIEAINRIKIEKIHFAWDLMAHSKRILAGLELYKAMAKRKPHGSYGTVYILTNYNTTMEENLHRIYTVQEMGYDPYVMVYDKPNAPKEIRHLQRWCNSAQIRKSEPDFYKYDPKKRRKAGD